MFRSIRSNAVTFSAVALVFALSTVLWGGTTGKISGRVIDTATGDPLIGVNVLIPGTTMGAATDLNGYYTILNVPPGDYNVESSAIGYARYIVEDVDVNIDLTTTINFELQSEVIAGQEVVVVASATIVQPDVSANVANITANEIENIPVAGVTEIINLQAGIEAGMRIRGSGLDEVGFVVDGVSMRQGRDNQPLTDVSFTSIQEFQIQTGGFNAEYGNVRSGVINVVTKEGSAQRYSADVLLRYTPVQRMTFYSSPDDPDGFFYRPVLDSATADVGTADGWDTYTQRQYPSFEGWDYWINQWASDPDTTNDLTKEQFIELFNWYHRKDVSDEARLPDYEIDGTLSGPVPFIGSMLGNLRFLVSYRETQSAYYVGHHRDSRDTYNTSMKLTSDITPTMKLAILGSVRSSYGVNGLGTSVNSVLSGAQGSRIWCDAYLNMEDEKHRTLGMTLTHTLNASTFHEFSLQTVNSEYNTWYTWNDPDHFLYDRRRTDTPIDSILTDNGSYFYLTEAPFGWSGVVESTPDGLYIGGHFAKAYDSSNVAVMDVRYDITSQVTPQIQVKAGGEFIHSNYRIYSQTVEEVFTHHAGTANIWERGASQGAAYLQSKIEWEGMVANLGLRADFFMPGGEWYDYETFDPAFTAASGADQFDNVVPKAPIDNQAFLSPRAGVSFPISANSKLFFNYGHFRQALNPQNMFTIGQSSNLNYVSSIGNPEHPMPLTVSYEVGYEQNLFNQYLLRVTGYYKALEDQSGSVRYSSEDGQVSYSVQMPRNYGDNRGFEATLNKNAGRFFRGFVNYTFQARKSGNFGLSRFYESVLDQEDYERTTSEHYQNRPNPDQFARANLEFLLPPGFGPKIAGFFPLGDWHASFLISWSAGNWTTWDGGADMPELQNNLQWVDDWSFDLRFSRNIDLGAGRRMQLYVDVDNVFNIKQLNTGAFYTTTSYSDREDYYYSLHLPEDIWQGYDAPYIYIPGDDRLGTYRPHNVEFQPLEAVADSAAREALVGRRSRPSDRAYYWEQETGTYWDWVDADEEWVQVDDATIDKILEDKAYIDMPNVEFAQFVNPRTFRFGIRVSF